MIELLKCHRLVIDAQIIVPYIGDVSVISNFYDNYVYY